MPARTFLRGQDSIVEPRKQWAARLVTGRASSTSWLPRVPAYTDDPARIATLRWFHSQRAQPVS